MALKMIKKPKLLDEFLEICKRNEYIRASLSGNIIKDVHFLKHTPNLQANIERQWLFKSKDIENSLATYSNADFAENGDNLTLLEKYSNIRKRNRLARANPFGLIEILNETQQTDTEIDENTISIQFNGSQKLLTCSYLMTEKQSREYFYRIQRLRKIWWMKYAANPGRFQISETKRNEEHNTESVLIKANYPFGNIEIERIEMLPIAVQNTESSNKKSAEPTKVVKTIMTSEVATIETILDAIDAGDFGEMCLNRKIAPYQMVVFILNKDESIAADLNDLAKYIQMLLNRSKITTFDFVDRSFDNESALDSKFNETDTIGIPYGLILDEISLQNGFMKLRSRDTTLSETIHISQLNDYVPKIFHS